MLSSIQTVVRVCSSCMFMCFSRTPNGRTSLQQGLSSWFSSCRFLQVEVTALCCASCFSSVWIQRKHGRHSIPHLTSVRYSDRISHWGNWVFILTIYSGERRLAVFRLFFPVMLWPTVDKSMQQSQCQVSLGGRSFKWQETNHLNRQSILSVVRA